MNLMTEVMISVKHLETLFRIKVYVIPLFICISQGMYRKALQLKKMINKSKVKGQTQTSQQADDNLPSELDVRFRIYQCHNILKNHREALAVVSELLSRETCLRLSYKGL